VTGEGLDVYRLRVFLAVAEEGSFSAAARRLHLSQPSVTFHIQAIEGYYQARLFERSSQGVELTEAGRMLQGYAREMLSLVERADRAMAASRGLVRGKLCLGASTIPGEYILPRILGGYASLYPEVELNLYVGDTGKVAELVASQQLDVGVIGAPVANRALVTEPFLPDELVLVVPPDHPLTDQGTAVGELTRYPLVQREPSSGTRMVMEERLREAGIEFERLKIAAEVGSTQAVKTAVEAGLGFSFVSRWAVQKELTLGTLREVRVEGLSMRRELYLVSHRQRLRTVAAQKLWELLLEFRRRWAGVAPPLNNWC